LHYCAHNSSTSLINCNRNAPAWANSKKKGSAVQIIRTENEKYCYLMTDEDSLCLVMTR
jgi:hypothetical protein